MHENVKSISVAALRRSNDAAPQMTTPAVSANLSVEADGLSASSLLKEGRIDQLRRAGLRVVTITGTVNRDGSDGADAVAALRLVRECTAQHLPVHWEMNQGSISDLDSLSSLFPPRALQGRQPMEPWRSKFKFDRLYWRSGPGFVQVCDTRGNTRDVYKLRTPELIEAFKGMLDGRPVSGSQLRHIDLLCQEKLAVIVGGWTLALPYRMRTWPIPCNTV